MNTIDNSDDFMEQLAALEGVSGPQRLLLVNLLKHEQEMETQGTEFRYKEGMNELIDSFIARNPE